MAAVLAQDPMIGAGNSHGISAKIISIIQVLWAMVIMGRIIQASIQDTINKVTLATTPNSVLTAVKAAAEDADGAVSTADTAVADTTITTAHTGSTRTGATHRSSSSSSSNSSRSLGPPRQTTSRMKRAPRPVKQLNNRAMWTNSAGRYAHARNPAMARGTPRIRQQIARASPRQGRVKLVLVLNILLLPRLVRITRMR